MDLISLAGFQPLRTKIKSACQCVYVCGNVFKYLGRVQMSPQDRNILSLASFKWFQQKKPFFFFKGATLLTLSHYMTLINPDWLSDKRVCRLQGCSQTSFYQITKACFITKINTRGVYNETFKRINEKRVRKKVERRLVVERIIWPTKRIVFSLSHTLAVSHHCSWVLYVVFLILSYCKSNCKCIKSHTW